jgi:hypothetical protein
MIKPFNDSLTLAKILITLDVLDVISYFFMI